MATTIYDVLETFREDARNNPDLGDRFERLMLRYFELDPLHAERFERVWMWNDWPWRGPTPEWKSCGPISCARPTMDNSA